MREPEGLGLVGALDGGLDHGLVSNLLDRRRMGRSGVGIHQTRHQFRVQAAPVDADTHRPVVPNGQLDQGGELAVAFLAATDVAGVDAVLGQGLGALGIVAQEPVAIEVEIPDQGDIQPHAIQGFANSRHGSGGIFIVDGDTNQFRTRASQFGDLAHAGGDIGRVRIGHGLDHQRRAAADLDIANPDGGGGMAVQGHD